MRVFNSNPIKYYLPVGKQELYLNDFLGQELKFYYKKIINCINCHKITKTSFANGYCYSCFVTLPQTDISIVHPEKDRSHLGISRDLEWAKKHNLCSHYVYLAYSGNMKIGVTREKNIPTRWIDQGAIAAIEIAKTPNRHIAGAIEVYLKKYISDKTNWRNMLKLQMITDIDLINEKKKIVDLLHPEFIKYVMDKKEVKYFTYPTINNPEQTKAIQFEKQNTINGKLIGIKGQYLIFDNGQVINIRRHAGYLTKVFHP